MVSLVSLMRFVGLIITGKIKFPKKYTEKWLQMDDGLRFQVFRHMKCSNKEFGEKGSIFIVRFKFKKFSHRVNKKASRIPIPLIGGFKGFRDKLWMIDWDTGYWQGVYQWNDESAIELYRKSFVLGIMNNRAIESSLTYWVIPNMSLDEYLNDRVVSIGSK